MIRQQILEKNIKKVEHEETKNETLVMKHVNSFESKLDSNSFDPSKFSPPNEFINKLKERIARSEKR
tara:strand:+ start:1070 stop:1270 length:201 start_codon:yes stop_codon:yes gene_type:complete